MAYGNLVLLVPIVWILGSIPAYVIGSRMEVRYPGVAFIPGVGPYIVILHSIKRSGWLCLLAFVPFANLIFFLWLLFTVPAEHGRTRWWALAFLVPVVNFVAYYVYAFTLDPNARPRSSSGVTSTYHVPPAGDWRR